ELPDYTVITPNDCLWTEADVQKGLIRVRTVKAEDGSSYQLSYLQLDDWWLPFCVLKFRPDGSKDEVFGKHGELLVDMNQPMINNARELQSVPASDGSLITLLYNKPYYYSE